MENLVEAKNLISSAKNIYLIPSENSEEAIPSALALFYILRDLGKNVNIIIENFPEKFKFLIPSSDFVSFPRNFVISLPNSVSNVSQIYYEKSAENLKIHLTIDKGAIKKDNFSFYYTDAKPDLIITLGIKNFKNELENKLNQFAFLMESDIMNIDSSAQDNLRFGKINLTEERAISEIVLDVAKLFSGNPEPIKKEPATCLLAGLIAYSENFTNQKTTSQIFDSAAFLMKRGADREKNIAEYNKIKANNQMANQKEIIEAVLAKISQQNLEINKENILKFLES